MQNREDENPNWLQLPDDITVNILHRLGAKEILESTQKVCTAWRRVCNDPTMWRVIDMWISWKLYGMYDINIMCRHVVDRSQGQLVDIKIPYCANDELLLYIGERCNNLKCLKLAICYGISVEVLIQVLKKFPNLEELHLFFMSPLIDEEIEIQNIGIACPNLKSFTYHDERHIYLMRTDAKRNSIALRVAKGMPNLHHLRLSGEPMKNEGLEAILNCCRHLKSLDIRQCFGVDLSGDLGKRCSQQIKHLRLPNDSTDDYEWKGNSYSIYDEHSLPQEPEFPNDHGFNGQVYQELITLFVDNYI